MRDLLFKNNTSYERKRKVLTSCEKFENEGVRTTVRRHFIYMVREVSAPLDPPVPNTLYVIKEHNNRLRMERFFCKMKGELYAQHDQRTYKVFFMHSLVINMSAVEETV